MPLWNWVTDRWNRTERIGELTEELAGQCAAEVRRSLSDQVFRMSLHERQGYVCAWSSAVVQRVLTDAAGRDSGIATIQSRLSRLVLDATTRKVQHQLGSTASKRLRRAA